MCAPGGEEPRPRVGGSRHGCGGAQPRRHPAAQGPEGPLTVGPARRGQPEGGRRPVGPGCGPPAADRASRHPVVRTPPPPRGEVVPGWPARHRQTPRAAEDPRRGRVKALARCQSHAAAPVQGCPHGTCGVRAAPRARARGRGHGRASAPVRDGLESRRARLIPGGDVLVRPVREGDRVGQRTQRLVAPMAREGAGDGGLLVLVALVTPERVAGGEWSWTALASAGVGPWRPPPGDEEQWGRGRGSGEMAARCHTGAGGRLAPVVSPRAPGTTLTNGHKAPMRSRSRPPAPIRQEESTGWVPRSFRLHGRETA